MRKAIDGLAAIVHQNFKLDVFSGSLFLFCGKRCDRIKALLELFKILDMTQEQRDIYDRYMDDDLAAFPYVNGGLFRDEDIEIPNFTEEIMEVLLEDASAGFNWTDISPTIFGAVFESTLNPETRRSGGMHYTSIENIHKVIDPLFLDELRAEFETIKESKQANVRRAKLEEFQKKLASLTFLDPACGSGNFLTETYISLRKLENEILKELYGEGQMLFDGFIQVSIGQFYGIEINDFAVTVAKTALWIAESQMMTETEEIIGKELDFLPLKSYANIVEGNALRTDWESVVPKDKLNYIMGNPPFVGMAWMSKAQKAELVTLFPENKKAGTLDYVSGWYVKALQYIKGTRINVAFVSTNSITQGEQIGALWKYLYEISEISINFAYRTFIWDSEANLKAHVHCVIIGFSAYATDGLKTLYITDGQKKSCSNINAYLLDSDNVIVERRTKPLCDVPTIHRGNQPTDGGNLMIEADEYEDFIKQEPNAVKYIKRFMMGYEFLNNKKRYCLWLVNVSPKELKSMPLVMKRVQAVKEMREQSTFEQTRKMAATPTRFRETFNPDYFIAIPKVSSERRRYIPIGYLDSNVIPGDKLFMIEDATLYHFGVLTSNVHMAWMRTVCGRLKSDYSYSKDIVYNNFPWCNPTGKQKAVIEKTAQAILDARANHPECSLADLYDERTMPADLRKAHQQNDFAVMAAYGFDRKITESECVAELMGMYREMTEGK